ncbi:hypothetical protein EVC45_14450 [Paraburkholderia sp. UYCP14C]|uniref:DUF4286 family protein n=1 Tax=Paraburkholderia sp. UYCP14C TaxID=2511130 RepID=UPI001020FC25|nr:DUF4286 family protein [Paraburkholderia sp. UYCP14C]RZF29012.1 hypothetical protein EVC45_14450 [Paraburkholderia sp. UYCP14C]
MSILGSAVVLIWNDVVDSARTEFYEWHNKEHIPERLSLEGFLRGRRYRGADASPEWLTVYEAADLGVLTGPAYLERLNNPTPATLATVKHFRNTARSLCRIEHSVGESNGAYAVTMQLQKAPGPKDDIQDFVSTQLFPEILARPDVVAVHLFAADLDASNVKTNEAQHRGGVGDVPARVVLIECTTEAGARAAARQMNDADWQRLGASHSPPQVYTLEISRLGKLR